jgi:hypothetical protein
MGKILNLAEVGDKVGNTGGGSLVGSVQCHDGLLPHGLLRVRKQLYNLWQHGGDGLPANEAARSGECCADDEVVVRPEVLLDGVDHEDEDDKVVSLVEEERNGEVPGPLERERLVVGHLNGVDVTEGGVMAEHLGVDEAEEELLHLAAGHVGVGEVALEVLELALEFAGRRGPAGPAARVSNTTKSWGGRYLGHRYFRRPDLSRRN